MDINSTLNEVLVKLFRSVNTIEEKAIRTEEYQDVTTNDMHVIEAIGVPSEYSEGTIRISFGRDNTEEDAIAIAKALVKVIKG